MTSSYERDPRVPPASVEHLGRHRPTVRSIASSLAGRPRVVDGDGPTYGDFLESDEEAADLPGELG